MSIDVPTDTASPPKRTDHAKRPRRGRLFAGVAGMLAIAAVGWFMTRPDDNSREPESLIALTNVPTEQRAPVDATSLKRAVLTDIVPRPVAPVVMGVSANQRYAALLLGAHHIIVVDMTNAQVTVRVVDTPASVQFSAVRAWVSDDGDSVMYSVENGIRTARKSSTSKADVTTISCKGLTHGGGAVSGKLAAFGGWWTDPTATEPDSPTRAFTCLIDTSTGKLVDRQPAGTPFPADASISERIKIPPPWVRASNVVDDNYLGGSHLIDRGFRWSYPMFATQVGDVIFGLIDRQPGGPGTPQIPTFVMTKVGTPTDHKTLLELPARDDAPLPLDNTCTYYRSDHTLRCNQGSRIGTLAFTYPAEEIRLVENSTDAMILDGVTVRTVQFPGGELVGALPGDWGRIPLKTTDGWVGQLADGSVGVIKKGEPVRSIPVPEGTLANVVAADETMAVITTSTTPEGINSEDGYDTFLVNLQDETLRPFSENSVQAAAFAGNTIVIAGIVDRALGVYPRTATQVGTNEPEPIRSFDDLMLIREIIGKPDGSFVAVGSDISGSLDARLEIGPNQTTATPDDVKLNPSKKVRNDGRRDNLRPTEDGKHFTSDDIKSSNLSTTITIYDQSRNKIGKLVVDEPLILRRVEILVNEVRLSGSDSTYIFTAPAN
jgi:hypothetical protein